jgi:methionyl aminopeptidase
VLQPTFATPRSDNDIAAMRRAGRVAADCLGVALRAARVSTTTADIATSVQSRMHELGAEPLFLGYRQGKHPPYPAVCCVSINDEIVHGVPGPRVIERTDLVSIDVGIRFEGWCADNAASLVVGETTDEPLLASSPLARKRLRLVQHTRATLDVCIRAMKPGVRWSTVAKAAEAYARRHEFGVVTEFVGHAIGRELHEPPKAPCYWTGFAGTDFTLEPGMTIAVEPILTLDPPRAWLRGNPPGPENRSFVKSTRPDAWTALTATGADACHVEHTVLVTEGGAEVLTARE